MPSHDFRRGTKQFMIAELCERGLSRRQAFNELRPLVENQIRPMVFSANVAGRRQPKPLYEQYVELRNSISRIYAQVGRVDNDAAFDAQDFNGEELEAETPQVDSPEIPADACDKCGKQNVELFHDDESGLSLCDDCLPGEGDEKIVARGKAKIRSEVLRFREELRRIREWCAQREKAGDYIDSISYRPAKEGVKLIHAGVPVEALLAAMTLHWDDDALRQAGIPSFDFVALSRRIMNERGIPVSVYHELFGYALILAENRVPMMLIGPFGTGKSTLAEQISEYLELPYSEAPMAQGAQRGDFLGRHSIGGFIPAQCCARYSTGGVFNFEEIDASDPAVLIVLNNALAGNKLFNSANGEVYDKHDDFIPVSTANTFGTGATREYTARERLDSATLDRWRMGRIFIPIDEKVEDSILGL